MVQSYSAIEIPGDQEELQRDLLTYLSGEKTGYWSIAYKNVNKFNMEMLNMSIITKWLIKIMKF